MMEGTTEAAQAAARYYDSVAETWDEGHGSLRQNSIFRQQFRTELAALLDDQDGQGIGLEVGAGTGAYVDVIAPRFRLLIATDVSEGMLSIFAQRLKINNIGNVELKNSDALDLRAFAPESVDVIISIGLLEVVPDILRFFGAAARVLKPTGTICGITSNGACPWYALRHLLRGQQHCRNESLYSANKLRTALISRGFSNVETKTWGVVPPGMNGGALAAAMSRLERLLTPTPVARWLGVLSFKARKTAC